MTTNPSPFIPALDILPSSPYASAPVVPPTVSPSTTQASTSTLAGVPGQFSPYYQPHSLAVPAGFVAADDMQRRQQYPQSAFPPYGYGPRTGAWGASTMYTMGPPPGVVPQTPASAPVIPTAQNTPWVPNPNTPAWSNSPAFLSAFNTPAWDPMNLGSPSWSPGNVGLGIGMPGAAAGWGVGAIPPAPPIPFGADPYAQVPVGGYPPHMGMPGMPPHMMAPAWAQRPAPPPMATQPGLGPMGQEGDRLPPFSEGRGYGPVLEPFLVPVVDAHVTLNPLLRPPPDKDEKDPFLQWNMTFPTSYCRRSDDAPRVSWSRGRKSPATHPRLSMLRVVCDRLLPWPIQVHAENPDVGVTCGEVVQAIYECMSKLAGKADFNALPLDRRRLVGEAYRHNRSTSPGVPGGFLGEGLLRLDFLERRCQFGGIVDDPVTLRRLLGMPESAPIMPGMFLLRTAMLYAMTREEVEDQEAAGRTSMEQQAAMQRAASVEAEPVLVAGPPPAVARVEPRPGRRDNETDRRRRARSRVRSRHRSLSGSSSSSFDHV